MTGDKPRLWEIDKPFEFLAEIAFSPKERQSSTLCKGVVVVVVVIIIIIIIIIIITTTTTTTS
jgi:hypothetical protein